MNYYIVLGEREVIISERRRERPHDLPPNFCPFCPGHEHMTPPAVFELKDGDSWKIRVIPNKFPCVSPEFNSAYGHHEVVVETPDHGKTFWLHAEDHISDIISTWAHRERELYKDERIQYVAIFKNWGKRAGASLSHGHSQIIALDFVPRKIRGKKPLEGYVVFEGEYWKVTVPKTPMFSYEVHLIPKRKVLHLYDLHAEEISELARFLREVIRKVVHIVDAYNFFIFTSPKNFEVPLHIEVYPRRNVHAGLELGAGVFVVPVSPETAVKYYKGP